jgi:hypothetical protein
MAARAGVIEQGRPPGQLTGMARTSLLLTVVACVASTGCAGAGGAGGAATTTTTSSTSSSTSGTGGTGGAATSTSSSSSSSSGELVCPTPATSWADCSVGLDPTIAGGDLLWAQAINLQGNAAPPSSNPPAQLALGPTGDVAILSSYYGPVTESMVVWEFNGSGCLLWDLDPPAPPGSFPGIMLSGVGNGTLGVGIDRHSDLIVLANWWGSPFSPPFAQFSALEPTGELSFQCTMPSPPDSSVDGIGIGPAWDSDALGNIFVTVSAPAGIDPPGLPGPGTYLVGAGSAGYLADFSGSFVADLTGGIYRFGALASTLDLGCGPMVSTSSSSTYLARLGPGPTWGACTAPCSPPPSPSSRTPAEARS